MRLSSGRLQRAARSRVTKNFALGYALLDSGLILTRLSLEAFKEERLPAGEPQISVNSGLGGGPPPSLPSPI
jgi:hypothetical protein